MVRWCFHFLNSVDVLSATSLQTYHLCRGPAPRSLSWWLTTSWPQRLCKDENYHRPKRGCQIHSKTSTRRAWYEEISWWWQTDSIRFSYSFDQFWAHFWCLLKVQRFSRVHSTGPCTGLEPLNQSKELGEERRSPIRSSSEVQSFYW